MNYFTSEADFNKGRHAPHRYHTDAFGAFGVLARNPKCLARGHKTSQTAFN